MSLTMSEIAVPAFTRALTAFTAVLAKTERVDNFAKIEPALMQARLFPDMFAFPRQVQTVSDFAKGAVGRLAGVDLPVFPDDETTFAGLRERLGKTLAFIASVPAERIDGSEQRSIEVRTSSQMQTFTGQDYLTRFALPNFYFHLTTAYDILRHNGIVLAKRDFIGEY